MTKKEIDTLLLSENKSVKQKVYVFNTFSQKIDRIEIREISPVLDNDIFLPSPHFLEKYNRVFLKKKECYEEVIQRFIEYSRNCPEELKKSFLDKADKFISEKINIIFKKNVVLKKLTKERKSILF